MSDFPTVFLARHGETAWSLSGRHTGLTDLPLTESGIAAARSLAAPLSGTTFSLVLTSPLVRAKRTCELAGFGGAALDDPDLAEWNYGEYEGRRTAEILSGRPGWKLFRDGCPGGESPADVGARADRVIARARAAQGNVLVFGSGHILRVVGARWLGLPPAGGAYFLLGTASLSALSYEHDMTEPVHRFWNDMRHLTPAHE
jgi:broad specificity phosphatase PhoE